MKNAATLPAIFSSWKIRVAAIALILASFVGIYDAASNEFPTLPRLPVIGTSETEIMPLWGWFLLLQGVVIYALFEYVGKNVPVPAPQISNDVAAKLDTIDSKIEIVRTQAAWSEKTLTDLFEANNRAHLDLAYLLRYSSRHATVTLIDSLISKAPPEGETIEDRRDQTAAKAWAKSVENFVDDAANHLAKLSGGYPVLAALESAKTAASNRVREMSQIGLYDEVHPIDLLQILTAELKRKEILSLLEKRRSFMLETMRDQRSELLSRLNAREP